MSLTTQQINAICVLNPQITRMVGDEAFDINGNPVAYDLNAANSKVSSDQAAEQTAAAHKASAVSKLTALGLSADEINALIG